MASLLFRPSFYKDLGSLKVKHHVNYRKACEILLELQTGTRVTTPRRSESRIPSPVKFELSEGYRLVLQQVGDDGSLVALAVGTHEHVEAFLDGHKGWVFDPKTGKLRELRLASIEEVTIESAPSADVFPDKSLVRDDAPAAEADSQMAETTKVFDSFNAELLERLGVPKELVLEVLAVDNPNSLAVMTILDAVSNANAVAADLLLAYATGDGETKQSVLAVANGSAAHLQALDDTAPELLKSVPEEFVTFDDSADLQEVLEKGTFQEWQLFLHPDQKDLVGRDFSGPARIRGISGSGKTVVALHRARRLAKQFGGANGWILFTTFNKALARSAAGLLEQLCGPELSIIEITHLHRWCLDFITFRGLKRPSYSPDGLRRAREVALRRLDVAERTLIKGVPVEYLWSEIEFIMGRFLHEDTPNYLQTDRSGRGRPLSVHQRTSVLKLYGHYLETLSSQGMTEPADFVRVAYRLRLAEEQPERHYAHVIIDEVQDMSEIALGLLHSLVGGAANGLLTVGDATQRIFTRGYSFRAMGIEVSGRSVVLRKNYRNTREILDASFPLVSSEWLADVEEATKAGIETEPVFSSRSGRRPMIVRCETESAEARFVRNEVVFLLDTGRYRPSDICVMGRNAHYRALIYSELKRAKVPAEHYQIEADGELSDAGGAVRVSSLHTAKGHEYAVVFVVGMVEGTFPPGGSMDADELAGERAVLYVGMTRARDALYLSYAMRADKGFALKPSMFLHEIAGRCEERRFSELGTRQESGLS